MELSYIAAHHQSSRPVSATVFRFCVAILLLSLAACHKPLPNPETQDPIYSDLVAEEDRALKGVTEEQTKIEELKKEMEKKRADDPERSHISGQITKANHRLVQIGQAAEFFKMRAESRKVIDQDSYAAAFNARKEASWPAADEIELYKTQKRLQTASRNWGDRVPRSKFLTPGSMKPSTGGAAKATAEKKEGGEGGKKE